MREALLDSTALRRFLGIDSWAWRGREPDADGTTLLKFRRLLEKRELGAVLLQRVNPTLLGVKVGRGTLVDATIIGAPSSTKHATRTRDLDMHPTCKGRQQGHFGMQMHIGVDSGPGLVRSAAVTVANVHDKHLLEDLLHGEERRVCGHSAYARRKALIREHAPKRRTSPTNASASEVRSTRPSVRAPAASPGSGTGRARHTSATATFRNRAPGHRGP